MALVKTAEIALADSTYVQLPITGDGTAENPLGLKLGEGLYVVDGALTTTAPTTPPTTVEPTAVTLSHDGGSSVDLGSVVNVTATVTPSGWSGTPDILVTGGSAGTVTHTGDTWTWPVTAGNGNATTGSMSIQVTAGKVSSEVLTMKVTLPVADPTSLKVVPYLRQIKNDNLSQIDPGDTIDGGSNYLVLDVFYEPKDWPGTTSLSLDGIVKTKDFQKLADGEVMWDNLVITKVSGQRVMATVHAGSLAQTLSFRVQ